MNLTESEQRTVFEFLRLGIQAISDLPLEEEEFVYNPAFEQAENREAGAAPIPAVSKENAQPQRKEAESIEASAAAKTLSDDELWALSQAAYEVSRCELCQLYKERTHTVFGEGCFSFAAEGQPKLRPTVFVIGEGPGHDEDVTGRPFVGRAGQLLDKMLAAIELSRQANCYICNIVKCRPPNNRTPLPSEVTPCLQYLNKQIEILKPKAILLMGRTAIHALLDTSDGLNRLHGQVFTYRGIPALCTYHPSALLRDENLKRPAWNDLKAFRALLERVGA